MGSAARRPDMGTWLLACFCCCAGWGGPSPAAGAAAGGTPGPLTGPLTCLSNNVLRIDCRWAGPELGPELAAGARPWLLFTSLQAPGGRHRCEFRGAPRCSVQLPPEEVLLPSDSFAITLHRRVSGRDQVRLLDPRYLPRRHVKLDPPTDLRGNVSADRCLLTWAVNPVLEPLSSLLAYQLAFKKREEAWEQARRKDHIIGVTWIALEAVELDPGSVYDAKLRVQMAPPEPGMEDEGYRGQWSEWSQPAHFLRAAGQPPGEQPDSTLVTVSVSLLLTSLAYLLFKLSPRVKRTLRQPVPSPAAFFQPLYRLHGGDFQTWTGAPRLPPHQPGAPGAPCVHEAISLLTCHPAQPWRPAGPQEGGAELPAGLPEGAAPPSAYLPQEDWAPAGHAGPPPPAAEGGPDYWALGWGGAEQPALPGDAGSTLAPAGQPACAQQDSWQGGGRGQRQAPGERAAGHHPAALRP